MGIILDESLMFKPHWKYRIDKAKKLLGKCNGIGNSQWGISPSSWRQLNMGMIRVVALWGSELGWRGQKEWEEEMNKLQYQALRKCTGAVKGARREVVSQIAGVESPRMVMDAAQARLMAKVMRDPTAVGDLLTEDV